jgi:hypothetical protein
MSLWRGKHIDPAVNDKSDAAGSSGPEFPDRAAPM